MEQIQIIRSRRKTICLQITPEGGILVRAPMGMSQRSIASFVQEKSGWIQAHQEKLRVQRELAQQDALTREDLKRLAWQAKAAIPPRVKYFAGQMGVDYGRITVRCQTSRWGSCSAKGNLNFNCLLMLSPPEVLDYVVVHELAHRRQMNHSAAFWAEVEAVLPDYSLRKQWLKEQGGVLMARLRAMEE